MLSQTARDDDLLPLIGQPHQGADGLLPGVLDEAAGVHHHHRGLLFIGTDAEARLGQQAEHVFGVDAILLAAQMGKGHGGS